MIEILYDANRSGLSSTREFINQTAACNTSERSKDVKLFVRKETSINVVQSSKDMPMRVKIFSGLKTKKSTKMNSYRFTCLPILVNSIRHFSSLPLVS